MPNIEETGYSDETFKATFFQMARREDPTVSKANSNPDEARDEKERWTTFGYSLDRRPAILDVQYPGRFHNSLVDDIYSWRDKNGDSVLWGVKVMGLNGFGAVPELIGFRR